MGTGAEVLGPTWRVWVCCVRLAVDRVVIIGGGGRAPRGIGGSGRLGGGCGGGGVIVRDTGVERAFGNAMSEINDQWTLELSNLVLFWLGYGMSKAVVSVSKSDGTRPS